MKLLSLLGVALLLATTGCSQKIGKFAAISHKEIPEQGLTVGAPGPTLGFAEDCVRTVFIYPSKWSYDMQAITKQACAGHVIRDAQLERNFWLIPLIYGKDCLKIEGWCSK